MLIDWFTVGAQVVNFLILVWLMKRFLYKPILDAIDAREKRIAGEIAEAEAVKAKADREREAFRDRNDAFDRERSALLTTAREEARAERQKLLEQSRADADELRARAREALRREQDCLRDEIARRAREEIFAISRKALAELAQTSLDERMAHVFASRLQALDSQERADLIGAFSSDPVRVRSAFEFAPESRTIIRSVLEDFFGAEVRIDFETGPNLISGIEVLTQGQKVAWNIEEYLAEMQKSMDELFPVEAASAGGQENR